MRWVQKSLRLSSRPRGIHLITEEIVQALPELDRTERGILHVFIQHTSAALTINENADPDVRSDFEAAISTIVPESLPFNHTCEGPDDMPAHLKTSLIGASVSIPVRAGVLALGTWQGIYLCEHRNHGGPRSIILTLWGE